MAVPVYRDALSSDERVSVRHLEHFLGGFPVRLVAPSSLGTLPLDFPVERFPAECFRSTSSYSRLLLSRGFYERFAAFDYLLVYQLDALVLSGDLLRWCRLGWDYLGAPWPEDPERPELGPERCGNGGLSLRRVEAFLEVLRERPAPPWLRLLRTPLPDLDNLPVAQRAVKRLNVARDARRGVGWYASHYTLNEDRFWSDRAVLFHPDFRVAPVTAAADFAFERQPRQRYAANGGRPPFGAHAWARWDRAFWEPWLLEAEAEDTS